MSLDAALFRRTNRVLLSMSVPANRLTTSGKFIIDFSLRSLYNVSIKYLCIKASEGVCLWALFLFSPMI